MRPLLSRVIPLVLCLWHRGLLGPRGHCPNSNGRSPARNSSACARPPTPIPRATTCSTRITTPSAACLQCGPIHSAAADWSRWPAGTIFRIRETGEIYRVDDYGWALAGHQHHRSLQTIARGDECVGRARGDDRESAMGRSESEPRRPAPALALPACAADDCGIEDRIDELEQPVPAMGPPPEPVLVASAPPPALAASAAAISVTRLPLSSPQARLKACRARSR